MKIAIDAVGAKVGGAATVLRQVLRAASVRPDISQATIYHSPELDLRGLIGPRSFEFVPVPLGERGPVGRLTWLHGGLPLAVRRVRPNAALMLSNAGLSFPGVPSVTLIHQSLPFWPPAMSLLSRPDRFRLRVVWGAMAVSCRLADVVAVQTHTMRDWVARAFRLDATKVRVCFPGPDVASAPAEVPPSLREMADEPASARLLYVGNGSQYKRIPDLVAGFSALRERRGDASLFLTLPRRSVSAPGVHCMGYLSRDELGWAYRHATMLVMPSEVETVCLPLLDAIEVGLPIVAADRPYAREVCGEAARYFEPTDRGSFVAAVTSIFGLPPPKPVRRRELGRSGVDLLLDAVVGVAR